MAAVVLVKLKLKLSLKVWLTGSGSCSCSVLEVEAVVVCALVEGNLEVKLPTIWTDGKAQPGTVSGGAVPAM